MIMKQKRKKEKSIAVNFMCFKLCIETETNNWNDNFYICINSNNGFY